MSLADALPLRRDAPAPAAADHEPDAAPPAPAEPRRAVPAWSISIAIHVLVLLLAWLMVIAAEELLEESPPLRSAVLEPPKAVETDNEREITEVEIALDVEAPESDQVSPISELELPVEEHSTEDESEAIEPKGREEAIASSEMGAEGAFMAIGAGGGAAGMFGSRTGGGKKRAIARFGGSKAAESSVDAALRWFKRHQGPDGEWDLVRHPANCADGAKCEPGVLDDTRGTVEEATLTCTGYALLCFLGAGHDHRTPGKYRAVVASALRWLVAQQKGDGSWPGRNYGQGVCAMALCEAYAMSNDPALRDPAKRAIDVILARQARIEGKAAGGSDPYGRLGWDYEGPNPARNDSSVTGWQVMALKSAAAAQFDVGAGLDGAKRWLRGAWEAANPDWRKLTDPYTAQSDFPYVWDASKAVIDPTSEDMGGTDGGGDWGHLPPVGALCAVFLGHPAGDILLESLCNRIMAEQLPKAWPVNTYQLYYSTLAIFMAGGPRWERWNAETRDLLVRAQRRGDDCFDGSWDAGGTRFWGHKTGRILSTAYCCLSLEVYYRYVPVAAQKRK